MMVIQLKIRLMLLLQSSISCLFLSVHSIPPKNNISTFVFIGPVVQLDRISDSDSEGWRFEPSRGHNQKLI